MKTCWYTPWSTLGIFVSWSTSRSFSISASLPFNVACPSTPNFTTFGFVPTVKMKTTVTWPVFLSFSSSLAPTSKVSSPCGGFSLSLMADTLFIATEIETSPSITDGKW